MLLTLTLMRIGKVDSWGQPGGLSYKAPMRWGTAAALLDMVDTIDAVNKEPKSLS